MRRRSVTRPSVASDGGRHLPGRLGEYPLGIDDTQHDFDETRDFSELPEDDPALDIHPDAFITRSGFLRGGDTTTAPPPASVGPPWSYDEADEQAHQFLLAVVGEREFAQVLDDPVEHARTNALMLLFSGDVQESFETYLARMPEPRAVAWRDLIAGGASSEAFGPLTLQEKLHESQVGDALQAGRKQHIINLFVGVLACAVLLVGGFFLYDQFLTEEARTQGAFQFDELAEEPAVAALAGGPPVTEPSLTTALTTTVAVAAGDGPEADRITVAPFSAYPHPPGSIRASLFQFAGSRHVVFVGPDGFTDDACLRASVVTSDFRPLDTITYGACGQPIGRAPAVGCLGATAVLLDLVVPAGEVSLPEGGSGFADQVRVQVIGDHIDYEVLTIRGTIEVSGADTVTVPRFGGEIGDELTFDLGADRIGRCTITGDIVGQS